MMPRLSFKNGPTGANTAIAPVIMAVSAVFSVFIMVVMVYAGGGGVRDTLFISTPCPLVGLVVLAS